jgi:hypothetical protein
MLATDARSEIDRSLLADARVRQYWDGERAIGTWLAERDLGGLGSSGVVWDAYFVFGPGATWEDEPAPLVDSGAPVVSNGERLREAVLAQL